MTTRAELRALAEKARQWTVDEPMATSYGDFGYYVPGGPPIELDDSPAGQADALYLAALDPRSVLDLLDELDHLEAAISRHESAMEDRCSECGVPIAEHPLTDACAIAQEQRTAPTPDDRDREVERIADCLRRARLVIFRLGTGYLNDPEEGAHALHDAGLRASGGNEG